MARHRRMYARTRKDGSFDVGIEQYDPATDRQAAVDAVAKRAIDQLGLDAESPYVTHHDVARAAKLGAELALEGVGIEHIWALLREQSVGVPLEDKTGQEEALKG